MAVTKQQVRVLMKEKQKGTLRRAAMLAAMSEKTARKHVKAHGEEKIVRRRDHRTRPDPFESHWNMILEMLGNSPTLEAKTILEYLMEKYPGVYKMSCLRTLQRRLSLWRVEHGPSKLAIFRQTHEPGSQSQSDWTHMKSLCITIGGKDFPHLLYHFIASYSSFESIMICASETFESLTRGYEKAVQELGGVLREHRTDNLTAATQSSGSERIFTARWKDFTSHYGVKPTRNTPGVSHENGVVEKSHDLFKKAVEQQLLLRGSRDFKTCDDYKDFLNKIKDKRNWARRDKIAEEQKYLKELPCNDFNEATLIRVCVTPESLIHVLGVVYSVPTRFIGKWIKVYVYHKRLELYLGSKLLLTIPRLEAGVLIDYRHLVESLLRKPGAFESYKYQGYLFPNLTFQKAYEILKAKRERASKDYIELLYLAVTEGEQQVTEAIGKVLEIGEMPIQEKVKSLLPKDQTPIEDVKIQAPSLKSYDELLSRKNIEDLDNQYLEPGFVAERSRS